MQGSGFGVQGSGCGAQDSVLGVQGSASGVQDAGCGVQGTRSRHASAQRASPRAQPENFVGELTFED